MYLFVLGFVVLLIVLLLEKVFVFFESCFFGWFFWIYNVGLVFILVMMVWYGCFMVFGLELFKMIVGIVGMGYILFSVGMVMLFLMFCICIIVVEWIDLFLVVVV